MVRVETLQDSLICAQLGATCSMGQSLPSSQVSLIMVTRDVNYNRNYVCPKAHHRNGFFLKAKGLMEAKIEFFCGYNGVLVL
jgi:hypothetical protein